MHCYKVSLLSVLFITEQILFLFVSNTKIPILSFVCGKIILHKCILCVKMFAKFIVKMVAKTPIILFFIANLIINS